MQYHEVHVFQFRVGFVNLIAVIVVVAAVVAVVTATSFFFVFYILRECVFFHFHLKKKRSFNTIAVSPQ